MQRHRVGRGKSSPLGCGVKASTRINGVAWLAHMQHEADSHVAQCVQSGDLVPRKVLQAHLQWTDAQVEAAVVSSRLVVLHDAQGHAFYPAFYFDMRYDRGAIENIAQLLSEASPTWRYLFLRCLGHRCVIDQRSIR
jgi:hypothetical protein